MNLTTFSYNNNKAFNVNDFHVPLCIHQSNQLVSVDLSDTSLGLLPLVTGIHHLQFLDFRNTSISGLSPGQLNELPQLEKIILSYNNLGEYIEQDIGGDIFRTSQRLVVLDLSMCNLSQIPYLEFSTLTSLQYLNLSDNRIEFVDLFLSNCTQLKLLNLSSNLVEQFSTNFTINQLEPLFNIRAFYQNTTSLEIDITGNPLSCLCNASLFVRWLQSKKVHFQTELQCLYTNRTWLKLESVDTYLLDDQCKLIRELKNNTNCPCDYKQLQLFYTIRYSLANFYCFYPDGKFVQMKLLESRAASQACSTTIQSFSFQIQERKF